MDAKVGVDTAENQPVKFDDLAGKSEKSSVSNFSTKAATLAPAKQAGEGSLLFPASEKSEEFLDEMCMHLLLLLRRPKSVDFHALRTSSLTILWLEEELRAAK